MKPVTDEKLKEVVIAAVPWKLISNFTYAREMMNDQRKQFAWFIVALVLLVVIENVLLFLEIFISEKIYVRTCPYCDYVHEQIKGRENEFEHINIGENMRNV